MLTQGRSTRQSVWVIANGQVSRDAFVESDANSTLALARRGISQVMRQLLYTSVNEAAALSKASGAKFTVISIPRAVPEAKEPFAFDPPEMRRLFDAGYAVALEQFSAPVITVAAR
jgi:hypothetical protein